MRNEIICHLPLVLAKRQFHLISRGKILPSEDQGENPDAIFHQMLIENTRQIPAGPAWLLAEDSLWIEAWDCEPQLLEPRDLDARSLSPRICGTWADQSGDAGWAGIAIEAIQKSQSFGLVPTPNLSTSKILDMFVEAQSLIDPKVRWKIPLSIFAWIPPKFEACVWTVFNPGTQASVLAARSNDRIVLDLTKRHEAASNKFSDAARAGAWVRLSSAQTPVQNVVRQSDTKAGVSFKKSENIFLSPPVEPKRHPGHISHPVHRSRKTAGNGKPFRVGRAIGTAVFLCCLGIVGWIALQYLPKLSLYFDSATTTEPLVQANTNLPGKPATNEDTGSDVETEKSATLVFTTTVGQRLLSEIAAASSSVVLPAAAGSEPIEVLKVPCNLAWAAELGFGLAMPGLFVDVTPVRGPTDPDPKLVVDLADRADSESGKMEIRLKQVGSESEHASTLEWTWLSAPSDAFREQIELGSMVIWLKTNPTARLTIPFQAPAVGRPFTLVDALMDGVDFKPHMAEVFARPENEKICSWSARAVMLGSPGPASNPADSLWLAPEPESNGPNLFQMNTKELESRVRSKLNGSRFSDIDKAVKEFVELISPVRLEVKMDVPRSSESGGMELHCGVRAIFYMRTSDGSSNSIIFQGNPDTNGENRKSEFVMKVRVMLANWLLRDLDLDPSSAGKLFQDADHLPELAELDLQVKSAIAQVMYESIGERLDFPVTYEVHRKTVLFGPDGKFQQEIQALRTH